MKRIDQLSARNSLVSTEGQAVKGMSGVRWIVVAAVLAAGCGGSSGPTSPGNPTGVPASPTGPSPTPVVTGSVTSATDDSAAGNVAFTLTAGGTLVGVSDIGGAFSVGFPAAGLNRTFLAAVGFVTRETNILAPAANLKLSLIPSTFDLASFNQMFRHAQVGGSGAGLTRWTSAPGLVIERRVVEFTEICALTYPALDEEINGVDTDRIIADMRDGYQLLTAGRLGPLASIETQEAEAGSTVSPRQSGKIVVMRGVGLTAKLGFWGYACWSRTADGEVAGGFIILDRDFDSSTNPSLSQYHRSLRMHELGHTLGCQHVSTGRLSVMNSNARTEPNDFDRQAALIATLRPTGNRMPDTDPMSHSATSASPTSQALIWHGAH